MIENLSQARDTIRAYFTTGASEREHLLACAFVDGWAGAPLTWCIDAEQYEAWSRGRDAARTCTRLELDERDGQLIERLERLGLKEEDE